MDLSSRRIVFVCVAPLAVVAALITMRAGPTSEKSTAHSHGQTGYLGAALATQGFSLARIHWRERDDIARLCGAEWRRSIRVLQPLLAGAQTRRLGSMKVILVCALMLAAATGALAAQAIDRPFLLHVNANTKGTNCGRSEWSTNDATCIGYSAPSGHSYGFSGADMWVLWGNPPQVTHSVGARQMPPKYKRWMKFCKDRDCNNWLLGAVQMPNGPFHVVDGRLDGRVVQPDDGDQARIGQPGGPLALIVEDAKSGNSAGYGYTFGLVGRIKF